ncbi:MAG: radical SAM protein [Chloroflexi bacterium]|nr:radical SAM protein [Chloroflexota bacterium]MDL1943092.1 radical SAM protein [Chloroflexi bacterium CFX2]
MSIPRVKLLMSNNALSDSKGEQCDCACAGDVNRSLSHPPSPGLFIGVSSLQYKDIDREHVLAFNPLTGNGVTVVNTPGRDLLESFRLPRVVNPDENLEIISGMMNLGLLTLKDESAELCLPPVPQVMSAWLHLTDRCNLRCSYCYLPHVREDMSSDTGRAAVDATFRSAVKNGFKQVKLKYAGGEPLLRFPLIEELHTYARQIAEKHGIDLEGVVLSNGTLLTSEMVESLKSLGLRLMISLDGLEQYHDSHRPYAGGRGSFADVAEAVDLALANGLVPNISVTISSRTAEGLPEVMAWILERALPFSLNFYRENELSASHEDMRLDEEKIINGMLAAFKVIENNLPRRPFLGGIVDRANLSASHTHTCGVGQNYLVFDQNGQVAKCQMHIRKPVTDAHAADPLAFIRADQIGIQNISVEEKEGCKTCEWKHWCAGGCPLATYRATGRYDVKSPNCRIYKALFPEALRLEGLRLLKYQDDPSVVVKL